MSTIQHGDGGYQARDHGERGRRRGRGRGTAAAPRRAPGLRPGGAKEPRARPGARGVGAAVRQAEPGPERSPREGQAGGAALRGGCRPPPARAGSAGPVRSVRHPPTHTPAGAGLPVPLRSALSAAVGPCHSPLPGGSRAPHRRRSAEAPRRGRAAPLHFPAAP